MNLSSINETYSKSHKISPWFCFALFGNIHVIRPYWILVNILLILLRLPHWQWLRFELLVLVCPSIPTLEGWFTGTGTSGNMHISWWRHQMETFSALLTLCAGNSPVTGEFPVQRSVTRGFDVFFDLRLDRQLSKQWRRWWYETLPLSLWRHCKVLHVPHVTLPWAETCFTWPEATQRKEMDSAWFGTCRLLISPVWNN